MTEQTQEVHASLPPVVLLALSSPMLSLLSCALGFRASMAKPELLQGLVEYEPKRNWSCWFP